MDEKLVHDHLTSMLDKVRNQEVLSLFSLLVNKVLIGAVGFKKTTQTLILNYLLDLLLGSQDQQRWKSLYALFFVEGVQQKLPAEFQKKTRDAIASKVKRID